MNLPKLYEPNEYESDIYALWEQSGAFKPERRGSKENFCIVIPPPNANGNLHLGHALTLGIEDILIRYHRMKGEKTLFLPGADHAGFETQVVYERELAREGKSRFDFSREELYSQIWDFVAQNKSNYESQFRRIGASLDWTRFTYTLDEKIIKQAYATFKKMWDEELIYRGERLVNFCTFHGTGFADIEVEYQELAGHLWHIRYPLTDGSGEVVVATTRPETMLGDVAVAVHPDDERYKLLIGRTIKLPLTNREIPVIGDEFVERDFGTGAVKITPAHDQNDYDAGQRHDLPSITVITHEGKLSHDVPEPYRNLSVEDAREAVVRDLQDTGLLVKTEDHIHKVGHCYKCGTVIQPLLREQWFVAMQPLASRAIKALREDKITFYPDSKKEQLITYLKGLRDWNISRQIAWGIPIPAFQNTDNPEEWIFDERVGQPLIETDGKVYRRDSDVFDTWFSSSSWPYATLDYPDSVDSKEFYPNSLMETGADILYPWVSRMIMFGLYTTGEVPFKEVYLHGLVLDEKGQKMSKSKGNVINPMEKIDVYGSDALRMGMISGITAGSNQPFGEPKLIGARNFCNKLWNIARYIENTVGDEHRSKSSPHPETAADHWILYKLQQSTSEISAHLDAYRLSEAYNTLYHFVWDEFADWYIEASKAEPNNATLAYCLESILKLAHPFAPFVTETIWQTLKWEGDSVLAIASWPRPNAADVKRAEEFETIKSIVEEIRFIRGVARLSGGLHLYHTGEKFLIEHAVLLKKLGQLDDVRTVRDGEGLHLTSVAFRCWLDLDRETMLNFLHELGKKREQQQASVNQLEARLANPSYVSNAPKALVAETRQQLEDAQTKLRTLSDEYQRFSAQG